MQVQDLGALSGDLLVFGGPYSNLQATRALLAEARARNIAPGNCVCTGDVVAYCADAAATVATVRAAGCPVVAGNCERQLARQAADCGCGFDPGTACDRLSAAWYAHAAAQIPPAARAWMAALPDLITFAHAGRRVAVLHGGASEIAHFLWPSSPAQDFAREIDLLAEEIGAVDMVLAGHCGLAFAREIDGVQWINAGAIGLPPHDGRAETRFALLTGTGVTFHRLAYDNAAAHAAMQAAGLTQGYDTALATGLWPSEDALPDALRRGVAPWADAANGGVTVP